MLPNSSEQVTYQLFLSSPMIITGFTDWFQVFWLVESRIWRLLMEYRREVVAGLWGLLVWQVTFCCSVHPSWVSTVTVNHEELSFGLRSLELQDLGQIRHCWSLCSLSCKDNLCNGRIIWDEDPHGSLYHILEKEHGIHYLMLQCGTHLTSL